MITGQLGALLEELGQALRLPNLQPDSNETCLLRLQNGVEVQIELDRRQNALIVGADLGELPLGRFREDLFEAALKANNDSKNPYGFFAYSQQKEHLILFDRLDLHELNGIKIADFLTPFSEKAKFWKESITNNQVPQGEGSGSGIKRGIFGLTP